VCDVRGGEISKKKIEELRLNGDTDAALPLEQILNRLFNTKKMKPVPAG